PDQRPGRGGPTETIGQLNRLATSGLMPDLTLMLDLDVAEGLRRARARRGALAACDPFERLPPPPPPRERGGARGGRASGTRPSSRSECGRAPGRSAIGSPSASA